MGTSKGLGPRNRLLDIKTQLKLLAFGMASNFHLQGFAIGNAALLEGLRPLTRGTLHVLN